MSGSFSPIAIVGIGALFPGAPGLDGYWDTVRGGIDTSREVPPGRWPVDPVRVAGGAEPVLDRVRSLRGCFLDRIPLERVAAAAPAGEGLDPDLVARLDPSVQIALVAGIDAWRSADTSAIDRARVAVVLGHLVLPTDGASAASAAILGDTVRERLLGPAPGALDRRPAGLAAGDPRDALGAGLPAAALARALALGGGSTTLDAACASSLYAIAQACADLAEGRIDAALAGGVSRPDALYTQMGFSQLRALSPTGRCRPFDARGDGLVVGEGAGIFLLRRLADAERDRQRILGVIRGIGLANDRAGSLLAPEPAGQLRALRAAYDAAGWHPTDVDLIECHATGTPVGDATELASLRALWGEDGWRPGQCALGAAKANVGHLLTAAGAASLARALLALAHGTFPPIANCSTPAARSESSPFRFPAAAEPWPRRAPDRPRRAAVSAFGFGGIDAHLLLEEALPARTPRAPRVAARSREPIAVVGAAARLGAWEDGALLARLLGDDSPAPPALPPRWFGVETSDWFRRGAERAGAPRAHRAGAVLVPPGRFRIPPAEIADCLPQQLLFLEVTRRALLAAGLGADLGERGGVFAGIALDLASTRFHLRWLAPQWVERWAAELGVELPAPARARFAAELADALSEPLTASRVMGSLGSIVASRAAREFKAGGASHTFSSDETSGFRALERAVRALERGELDLAIAGAVDLGGDVRSELSRLRIVAPAGDGAELVEGAVALALERLADSERAGRRPLAVIEGLGCASGGGIAPPRASRVAFGRSIERALADAAVDGDRIGLVVAGTSEGEAAALAQARLGLAEGPHLASAAERVGHAGAAASLVAVLQGIAALAHGTLPPHSGRVPDALAPRVRSSERPEPWLADRAERPRRALVGAGGIDGNVGHVVLAEAVRFGSGAESAVGRSHSPLRAVDGRPGLFVLEGDGDGDLLRALDELAARLPAADGAPVAAIAARFLAERPLDRRRPRALALVAPAAGDLRRRIARARAALLGAIPVAEAERDIALGATVLSSPTPLGQAGQVALLFPGSGNDHLGMGRDLLARFPAVWRPLEETCARLASQLPTAAIWDEPFAPQARDRILGHVFVAAAAAELLALSGVRPRAALGYSLGETAAMFALGVWRDRDEMLARLLASDLFTRELSGPCRAAARHWRLPPGEPARWRSGVVDRPAAEVRRALAGRDRVYLQIVNGPAECVIGGDPGAVDALVADLGAAFLPVEGVTTVHAPVVAEVEAAYRALHRFPVHPPEGIAVWSPARGAPHEITTESVAESITAQALHGFDWTRSMESAYARGARLFVETGPGSSLARLAGAILGGRPHRAVSLVRAREPIELSLARVVATLAAERAEVDAEVVVGEVVEPAIEIAGAVRVESGGDAFALPEGSLSTDSGPRNPEPGARSSELGARSSEVGGRRSEVGGRIPVSRCLSHPTPRPHREAWMISESASSTSAHVSRAAHRLREIAVDLGALRERQRALIAGLADASSRCSSLGEASIAGEGTGTGRVRPEPVPVERRGEFPPVPVPDPESSLDASSRPFSLREAGIAEEGTGTGRVRPEPVPVESRSGFPPVPVPDPESSLDASSRCSSLGEAGIAGEGTGTGRVRPEPVPVESRSGFPPVPVPDPESSLDASSRLSSLREAGIAEEGTGTGRVRPEPVPVESRGEFPPVPVPVPDPESSLDASSRLSSLREAGIAEEGTGTGRVRPEPVPVGGRGGFLVEGPSGSPWLSRERCLEFARGSIAAALRDPRFAAIDSHPTRVRLPDEPLMLVDRIIAVEGEPFSLGGGRVVTEHDVRPDSWYLDAGRAPTCIAVEAGQADLFLSAWLGADLRTRGLAVYRLLDAEVTFHRALPRAGETIRYDIRIERFFEQGGSLLFRFRFDATSDGELVLTMRDGCAGFFDGAALAAGRGIVEPRARPRPPARAPAGWRHPSGIGATALDAAALARLRAGDLAGAFGDAFRALPLARPAILPALHLLDRVTSLDPTGGAWGLGRITAELDIHADDWFLTCHFVDDQVMPGTLMYECCLHTLRVLLGGLGWVGEEGEVEAHPVAGVPGRLRCRGQVIPTSRVVGYDVQIQEIGLEPEPYAIAEAKMLVDGREIVAMQGLSVRMVGMTKERIGAVWAARTGAGDSSTGLAPAVLGRCLSHLPDPSPPIALETPLSPTPRAGPMRRDFDRAREDGTGTPESPEHGVARFREDGTGTPLRGEPVPYDHASILAFALGRPSDAFGERYRPFDERFIARLPAPPYCFLDGISEVVGPPWELCDGTRCVAEYAVPSGEWTFDAAQSDSMPFAVLLEVALQPCGWLAAYQGSALTSDEPLHFRNLGGRAVQHRAVTRASGRLRTAVTMTGHSASAGMLIEHFAFEVRDAVGPVYSGTTYFGFFPRPALAAQVGIRGAAPAGFPVADSPGFAPRAIPGSSDPRWHMVERLDAFDPRGGPAGLGALRGSIAVDPDAWFFRAHFHQDPVWPGSLGLESFLQLASVAARDRFGAGSLGLALGVPHEWTYRGQVLRHRERVTVEAVVVAADHERRRLTADGRLLVDGLWIYAMKGFALEPPRGAPGASR